MWKQTHREKLKNQNKLKIYNSLVSSLSVMMVYEVAKKIPKIPKTCINRIENITLTNLVFSSLKNTTCLLRT
jgi:hypothetical protein